MGNISFYTLGIFAVIIFSIMLFIFAIVNKRSTFVLLWVLLCILHIFCSIHEVDEERNRNCKEAYYKNIHMGEWVTGILREDEDLSVYFNRVELAGPMQYADEFFDRYDRIRWCPICYWQNHNFELADTKNYIMVMDEDINEDAYRDVELRKINSCPGISYFEWNPELFKKEDFLCYTADGEDGMQVYYKGDVDTVIVYDNTFYYAEWMGNGMMRASIKTEDFTLDYFELFNIKELTKSERINLNAGKTK